MTPDFILGQLRLAAVAILAYCGGKGWLTPSDSTLLVALGTSLGPILVPWALSIYTNVGIVHVASSSAAAEVAQVEKTSPSAAATGAATAVATAKAQ
jgi:hypothetical protein